MQAQGFRADKGGLRASLLRSLRQFSRRIEGGRTGIDQCEHTGIGRNFAGQQGGSGLQIEHLLVTPGQRAEARFAAVCM